MKYNQPFDQTNPSAGYVNGNPATNTAGSIPCAEGLEYPQRELVAMITASGQSPANDVLVQAAIALGRGIWVDNLTGTGDLAVATLGVVLPALLKGMRIGGVATAANTVTNPKLRVVNLGTLGGYTDFPIIKEDGSLAIGEIKAGRRYRYEADGAGSVVISGGGVGGVFSRPQSAVILPYETPGTYTWTVPAGVYWIYVRLVGGGGGACGGNGSVSYSGGGGGSGGYSEGWVQVTPGQQITIIVGAPGAAGPNVNGAQAGTGGTSSFGSYLGATGGSGGKIGNATSAGGTPGLGYGGQINQYGASGGDGNITSATVQGGQGGASAFGGGGRTSTDGTGNAGLAKGSGAGGVWGQGSASVSGAAGASGAVYLYPLGASS